MDKAVDRTRLGLALSGGGVRAAVFHLGVLRHLAKLGRLEEVAQMSTVSGGSLIIGAIFSHADFKWPTSEQFLNEIYPVLRGRLTAGDLFSLSALGWRGIIRENIRILFRRAEILSELLSARWCVRGSVKDLPDTPEWHINTTCFETGKNWRFSKRMMGDWQFGRHFSPDVPIAKAIAASAAVPYAIGVLRLELPEHGWWKTDRATKKPQEKISRPMRRVRLWDGGAYENMGLEALYKPADGLQGCDFLICSDASGPLTPPKPFSITGMLQGRLNSPRLFDIASDQIRALRSRMLMGSIQRGEVKGVLIRMGVSMRQFGMEPAALAERLTDEQSALSLNYPTNLTKISEDDFDLLSRHGAEVCEATLVTYMRA
ncbi:patatin-like phospholipase family protein [Rhizobium oryzicola]|uniref:Patatin-like phospholipase family protein n=1 Tax=Rhizobium oryzicola TaxID=1232668 RepID=A0ABT8SYW3_9HYPH|nr:patatin-like phospholipase family protein [Rhizobium oryzicola]MDO1583617.1 patatin-like phospholipase family protein [Rhizobium oryzicola]